MTDLLQLTDQQLLDLAKRTKQQIAECNNKQSALKILLNGGYGALSNEHNRWYSDDLAESITLSGQLAARWIIQHLNRFLNQLFETTALDYIVACDTDSVHLNVEAALEKQFKGRPIDHETKMVFLEQFAELLSKEIENGYELLYQEVNAFQKAMHMKLETIAEAVWTGKKHYAMQVWANEGVRYWPPDLKMVGIEAVKSSTPKACREYIKSVIPLIIEGDLAKLKKQIDEYWQEFITLPFEAVAFPRSVSDLDKHAIADTVYGKGTPIHARGALLYNSQVAKHNLSAMLPLIINGDKIRFAYMKLPNPIGENVFACPDTLPEQFGLESFIDYDTQFEKSFLQPIRHLTDAVKMYITHDIDMDQFWE